MLRSSGKHDRSQGRFRDSIAAVAELFRLIRQEFREPFPHLVLYLFCGYIVLITVLLLLG